MRGEVYSLNDVYPDYTPQEYEFSVSNYDDTDINSVPMTYYFEDTIDSPLSIKIYDESGNEVLDSVTIDGDGQTKIKHTYIVKVIWDDSSVGESYNSADYANKEYNAKIVLKAYPGNEKYLDYTLTKEFNIDITTVPFYFNTDVVENIKVEKNGSSLSITVSNNNSDSEYNLIDTDYEISITGNDKFSFTMNDESPSNGVFSKTLGSGLATTNSFTIKLLADINTLNETETATLNIKVKSPYTKTIAIPLTISLQKVTVTLNADGGSVSPTSFVTYKGKTYSDLPTPTWDGHTFNGWYTSTSYDTLVQSTTEVTTTSSTQTLYAKWTSRLLVDKVNTGDYVNYGISYSNVAISNNSTTFTASLTGWRVLDVVGEGDNRYVRLVSAGIPLSYRHPWSGVSSTSVTALTTGFFNTAITSTATNYKFYLCGFTGVTTIAQLKSKFISNEFTQLDSSGVPMVQALTAEDIYSASKITVEDGTDFTNNPLWGIKATTSSGAYSYVAYYLATEHDDAYLYSPYFEGIVVYTASSTPRGIRTVVSLKVGVEATLGSDDVWQLTLPE